MDLLICMFTHSRLGIYIYTTFIFTKFHQNAIFFWDVSFTKTFGISVTMIIGTGLCELSIKSIRDCHSNNYGPGPLDIFVEWNGMKQCFFKTFCHFISQLHIRIISISHFKNIWIKKKFLVLVQIKKNYYMLHNTLDNLFFLAKFYLF